MRFKPILMITGRAPFMAVNAPVTRSSRRAVSSFWMVTACITFSFILMGCGPPEGEVDPLILTQSDSLLVEVLMDLHVVDAELYTKALGQLDEDAPLAFDFKDTTLRDSVLAQHDMDEATFMLLVEEHLEAPDRFLMVYNRVLDRAARR